jgi:hypothetical protein
MPAKDGLDCKRRILVKLTSSRFWGACIVTAIATWAMFALLPDNEVFKLGCLGIIAAKWGSFDFSKKVNP